MFAVNKTQTLTMKVDDIVLARGKAAANTDEWRELLARAKAAPDTAALRQAVADAEAAVTQRDVDVTAAALKALLEE